MVPRASNEEVNMTRDGWIEDEGEVLDSCDDTTGWVVQGPGTLTLDPYHHVTGNASLKVDNLAEGNDTYIYKNVSLDLSSMKTLQARIFVYQSANYSQDIFEIGFFTNNSSPYQWIRETWVYLRPGWNYVSVPLDMMDQYNGIDLSTQTVIRIRLGFFSGTGSTLVASVDEIRINLKNKPVCLLTYDDGRKNVATNCLPICQALEAEHGVRIPGTMYLCKMHADLGEGGSPLYLTYAQIQALQDAGWTIANHTLTHPYLTSLTDDEIVAEITGMADWLMSMGWGRAPNHFAYPYGATSPDIYGGMARSGVLSARCVSGGLWQTPEFFRHKMAAVVSLGKEYMGVAEAKTYIDHAIEYGEVCVFTIHGCQDEPVTEEFTPAEYTELLEYGIVAGIEFITINELIDGMEVDDIYPLGSAQIMMKGEAATINFLAWDVAHSRGKTGDSENITMKLILDGVMSTPTNEQVEIDTDAPGMYSLALTASEMNHNTISVVGQSSSPNVTIVPVYIATQSYHIQGSSTYTDEVLDTNGDPIDGAQIEAYSDSDRTTLVDVQVSDVNGSFTCHLNPGTYYFRAVKAGYSIDDWSEVIA